MEPWISTEIPLPDAFGDHVSKVPFDGRPLLIEGMAFMTKDGSGSAVESGNSRNRQIEVVLHGLLLTFALYMPFIIFAAVESGYWLMRRSSLPVDEITRRAEGITITSLSERLPVINTGDELKRLSISLNHMIERLDEAFQHVNRFSAGCLARIADAVDDSSTGTGRHSQSQRLNPSLTDQIGARSKRRIACPTSWRACWPFHAWMRAK